jgi:hypothetical protein
VGQARSCGGVCKSGVIFAGPRLPVALLRSKQINSWEHTHVKATSRPEHQLKGSDKGGSKDKLVTSVQDKYNTPDEERSKEKKL